MHSNALKSLKALLLYHGTKFPHTHNIGVLVDLIKKTGIHFPNHFEPAIRMTQYVAEGRYPHEIEPIPLAQFHEELSLAKRIYSWVSEIISENQ